MAEVTYICKRTAVSTKPVQPGKYFQFSVLDRLMEQNHIRIVYYYRAPEGLQPGEIIRKLRESLSEVLSCYPIVAGRLQRDEEDNWMIKCNDAGLRMVEAKVKGSLDEWLSCVDREKELKLVYWEEMYHKPYFWSTFYVQLTEFEKGGVAIGLSCFHLMADPTCATMFIRAWAGTTLHGGMIYPPLFHPLPTRKLLSNKSSSNKAYTHSIDHYSSYIHSSSSDIVTKYTTISFAFSEKNVQACIDMARTNSSTTGSSPSPFEALAGLFWICISKVKGNKEGFVNMSLCLDARKVLGLDKGFFGNCVIYNKVNVSPHCIDEKKFSRAAKAIGDTTRAMDYEVIMDFIEWLEQNYPKNSPTMMNDQNIMCASLESVDPYEAMFKDGFLPIRVSHYVEPVNGIGQVLVLPTPPGEGPLSRTVMVTLAENENAQLCEDALILSFSPKILMGLSNIIA